MKLPSKAVHEQTLAPSAHTQHTTLPISLPPRAPPESRCNSYTHFHKEDAESGGACLSSHSGGWGRRIVPDQPVSINILTTFSKCNALEYLTLPIPSKSFHSAFSPLRKYFVYFILNRLKYMEITHVNCKNDWLHSLGFISRPLSILCKTALLRISLSWHFYSIKLIF